MKRPLWFLSITLLTSCLITPEYAQAAAPEKPPKSSGLKVGVELLTDTNGISVDAYIRTLISNLKERWIPLMTGEAQPLKSQEETVIDFTIAPDGQISAMRMENSTHDVTLDKAAWSATKATSYSPPPAGMREPNLKLRVHFTVD
jgi:TonB family protein